MLIKTATYIKSSPAVKDCPGGNVPEFAFIGRSNVGKSSLINMLTNRNKLAKTSATPGKTRLINHFLINDNWYVVDLPGYGFAKVSKKERKKFGALIEEYILKSRALFCLYILIDANIPPQRIDLEFVNWLGKHQVPFAIVFTKTDKSNQKRIHQHIKAFEESLKETWDELPPVFLSSAEKKTGKPELLAHIEELLDSAAHNQSGSSWN